MGVSIPATAANWWERSPNATNDNNFCNVNTSGAANNNNASNSLGLAPDFVSRLYRRRSNAVARKARQTFTKGEIFPVSKDRNSFLMLTHERRAAGGRPRAWRGTCLTPFHVQQLSRLDGTLQDTCTRNETP